jgi:hypothetical protein
MFGFSRQGRGDDAACAVYTAWNQGAENRASRPMAGQIRRKIDSVRRLQSKREVPFGSNSWFKDALGGAPKSDVRALRKGMLFQQIMVSDGQALISPYLFSANTGYSPCVDIKESCQVFDAFRATGDFDLRTFSTRAYPVDKVPELRPGMSAYTDWRARG